MDDTFRYKNVELYIQKLDDIIINFYCRIKNIKHQSPFLRKKKLYQCEEIICEKRKIRSLLQDIYVLHCNAENGSLLSEDPDEHDPPSVVINKNKCEGEIIIIYNLIEDIKKNVEKLITTLNSQF